MDDREPLAIFEADEAKRLDKIPPDALQNASNIPKSKITQGQLEAVALRFRDELNVSLQRPGTGATATLKENVLSVELAHSLSAAEHNLMRRQSGRELFQHYFEELAELMYPTFVEHIEDILPISVTYSGVKVDCDQDSIIFSFGIRINTCWTETFVEANTYREYA